MIVVEPCCIHEERQKQVLDGVKEVRLGVGVWSLMRVRLQIRTRTNAESPFHRFEPCLRLAAKRWRLVHVRHLARVGVALAWLQWFAAVLDALENIGLLRMLHGHMLAPWPQLARSCALPKFGIVLTGLGYVTVTGLRLAFRAARYTAKR